MENLSDVEVKNFEPSIYLSPFRMYFKQNGKQRTWDLISGHDSVSILIYNISRNVLVFVKQFRPPVYFASIPTNERFGAIDVNKYPASLGITLECCAGIIDKNVPVVQIAKEEVLEECGYDIPVASLEKISHNRAGVGQNGAVMTSYYCEVTDDMKVSQGGGVDDEIIDVVEMTVSEIRKYISQELINSPPSFLHSIYWFLLNKVKE